ncbi:MAG: transcriptional repressor [Candidatus Latescibacterota bacterium]|nr:MAG: transcriptional repressor [Candidatus Latescibacterota bacterium]
MTIQRRVILETVLDLDNHPTADQVFVEASKRIPDISRTTVYRTLDTLTRISVITKACHPGSSVRYDTRIDVHHHLVCQSCDDVIDISDDRLDRIPIPDTSSLGFEVNDFSVQLRGICSRCKQKEDQS